MSAILNSLNVNNFPIFQPILMNSFQNSWFKEFFLIKHTYDKGCCPHCTSRENNSCYQRFPGVIFSKC